MMIDQQQSIRTKAPDKKPRVWTLEHISLRGQPTAATIPRNCFADARKSSHQHPKASVVPLDDHVFVEVTVGNIGLPGKLPRLPLVLRCVDIGEAQVTHVFAHW